MQETKNFEISNLGYQDIPQDVIDYYISKFILEDSSKYSNEFILKIFKALCYKLTLDYYPDIKIELVSQKELDKKSKVEDSIGLFSYDTIYLSIESLLFIRNKDIEPINTIMHEVSHLRQRHMLETFDISIKSYNLIVDTIITSEMSDDYYKDNYWYLFEEVDARYDSSIATYRYLKRICPTKAEDILAESIAYIVACKEESNHVKRKVGDKTISKEELLDRIIRRKPYYLNLYPLLNFYYDETGRKYTVKEILIRMSPYQGKDKDIVDKILALDKLILKSRDGTFNNLKRDLSSLYDADLIEICSKDEYLSELREYLVDYLADQIYSRTDKNQLESLYDYFQNKIYFIKKIIEEEMSKFNILQYKLFFMLNNLENPFMSSNIKNKEKMKRK